MPELRGNRAREPEPLASLPKTVVTKDRQILETTGDVWLLRANADGGGQVAIDFRPIVGVASPRFVEISKRFVAKKATTYAAWSLANIAFAISRAVRFWREQSSDCEIEWHNLGIAEFQSLLSKGLESPQGVGGNDFAHMRAIYAWGCHVAGLADFDPELAIQLKAIRAPGNAKGTKVLSSNPEEGPFSPEEVELLDHALKEGGGAPGALIVTQLFQELGLRPIQLLRTRWAGLRRFEANIVENGQPRQLVRYTLAIPRAKERGEYRVEEIRPISTLLGRRLESMAPAAPTESSPLCWWLGADASSATVADSVQAWIDQALITSPRTGGALKANPSRFRYTLATEAARDGASRFDIAYLLFHKDLQNVDVYFDAAGTVMEQIEEQLDRAFGNHLNRFLGKVASASDTSPHSGVSRRVVPGVFPQFLEIPLQLGLGACGQSEAPNSVCKLAPPLSCYRCPKFAAFREADHKSVGDALETLARRKFGGRADERVGGELLLTIQAIRHLERQLEDEAQHEQS